VPSGPLQARFDIDPSMLDPGQIPKATAFRIPPRSGQGGSDVYHLDLAHRDVFARLDEGSRVLECGCGGGQMRGWVIARGHDYVGTDISSSRVFDWLQEHGGPDLICDSHALPFREASFDLGYAAAVWEHLAFPQLATKEVFRVLKPGGYFLGSASFLEPWHDESYFHGSANGVFSMLRLAGFEAEAIWPERAWPGFRAMLKMGNAATRPVAWLGDLMNAYYLQPKRLKLLLKKRRWPTDTDLYEDRARMAGAIAWIARKP
jgi:SAM-dependent methyltransferase